MKARLLAIAGIAALPCLAHAQDVVGRRERTWSVTERLSAGSDVNLYTPIGTITVTEGRGDELEYRAEKVRGDADDIGFVVRKASGGITICAVYDEDDECRDDGLHSNRRWKNWGNRAKVNITVSVPAGMRVHVASGNGDVSVAAAASSAKVSSGNGKVRVSRVQGRVDASTGNGAVFIDDVTGPVTTSTGNGDMSIGTVNGPVSATSGNGDIIVSMRRLSGDGDLEFSSGNGRIEVTLPADFSAELDADTGNGSIMTDFPVRIVGKLTKNRIRGTIGDGKRRLSMHTGNGSMEIRKVS